MQELKDIPDAVPIMVNAISIAISGSGILSRFKAIFIRKRLTSHAKIEDLIEAIGSIIEIIPTNEYYALSTLINNLPSTYSLTLPELLPPKQLVPYAYSENGDRFG